MKSIGLIGQDIVSSDVALDKGIFVIHILYPYQ